MAIICFMHTVKPMALDSPHGCLGLTLLCYCHPAQPSGAVDLRTGSLVNLVHCPSVLMHAKRCRVKRLGKGEMILDMNVGGRLNFTQFFSNMIWLPFLLKVRGGDGNAPPLHQPSVDCWAESLVEKTAKFSFQHLLGCAPHPQNYSPSIKMLYRIQFSGGNAQNHHCFFYFV